jgi:hypothetical protein
MFEANASAGGSVMLPASKPLSAMKFIFSMARANTPTIRRGKMAIAGPAKSQSAPAELKTDALVTPAMLVVTDQVTLRISR